MKEGGIKDGLKGQVIKQRQQNKSDYRLIGSEELDKNICC